MSQYLIIGQNRDIGDESINQFFELTSDWSGTDDHRLIIQGGRFFHQLGPKAFRLVVVHQHIAFIESTGDTKGQLPVIYPAGVHHSRLRQGSE